MPHITYRNKKIVFILLCVVFSSSIISQEIFINSGWQFSENKITWETVNIPHTWNDKNAFDDEKGYRRGFGYYKKEIFVSSEEKQKVHYVKFNAVNQEAKVYINGKLIGNHKGGYTAFNFDITPYIKYDTYNLIEVSVDNSHNENIPPLDADFTFYGGIYRDVELISLPKQHFSLSDFASDGFYVNYYNIGKEKAGVEVDIKIENKASKKQKTLLNVALFDAKGKRIKTHSETFKFNPNTSNDVKVKLSEVVNPVLWSPENPYLYSLKLTLSNKDGAVLDSKSTNVGFRWTYLDPEKGFFLNDKPYKLIGVNRHQDYEGYGNAVPIDLQKKDIEIIKNMGANIIRFAHYPHSRELYEMCDKLGILVWTEIPIVNKVTDSPEFFGTSINMQKEHVKQYYNYPSVVMFGYMNEIFLRLAFDNESSEEQKKNIKSSSLKLAQLLEDLTRQLAPNHITVMACHLNEVYNETGIADLPMLLGWNLYFGWYDKSIPDLGIFLDDQHRRYPNRSLLLSEYGPGADIRIYTKTPKKFDFSTDYQAKLHQSYYQQITERPFMTGMTAWNFADFGSEFRGDAIPHVNQKGLLQYNRAPKEIYYWYKSVLDNSQPFVRIAANNLSGITLFNDETYPVQIYSNQDEVSVYLNDKKLKVLSIENGCASIEIPFVNGKNVLKAISNSTQDEQIVEVLKINRIDFNEFNRFGINLGSHFYFTDKEHQITWVPDQKYAKGLYGYKDGSVFNLSKEKHQGIPYNIRNTTSEPLFQTMLEDCTNYKVDIPKGTYKVSLFFVEHQIKPTENIYSLFENQETITKKQRIFDIYLNDQLLQSNFNIVNEYPEKYGITKTGSITISDENGLTINLKPVEGKPVISGILIKKTD